MKKGSTCQQRPKRAKRVRPGAATFPTPEQFSSWVGACPGREESAGENRSGRCPKGNRYLRRVLCQAAQAAVQTKNSRFQAFFHRLLPRLGYTKAIWAVVRHRAELIWKMGDHPAGRPAPRPEDRATTTETWLCRPAHTPHHPEPCRVTFDGAVLTSMRAYEHSSFRGHGNRRARRAA